MPVGPAQSNLVQVNPTKSNHSPGPEGKKMDGKKMGKGRISVYQRKSAVPVSLPIFLPYIPGSFLCFLCALCGYFIES